MSAPKAQHTRLRSVAYAPSYYGCDWGFRPRPLILGVHPKPQEVNQLGRVGFRGNSLTLYHGDTFDLFLLTCSGKAASC